MSITPIDVIIDPPLPTDTPSVFDQKAFAAWAALNGWAQQANALAQQVNEDAERVNDPAVQAVADNITAVQGVHANCANINTVAARDADIGTVASNITAVQTASANIAAIQEAPGAASNAAASATAAANSAASAIEAASLAQSIVWDGATGHPTMRPTKIVDYANTLSFIGHFERSTEATMRDALGRIISVPLGGPRIGYGQFDVPKGLIVERAATNLVSESESGYTKSDSSPGLEFDYGPGPGGLRRSAYFHSALSYTGFIRSGSAVSFEQGKVYTISAYCRPVGGASGPILVLYGPNDVFGTNRQVRVQRNGTVYAFGGPLGVGSEDVGDGWVRAWVTVVAEQSGVSSQVRFLLGGANDETNGWEVFGLQVEEGYFPTSYIPTFGSQVTRLGDAADIPLPDAFRDREGTLYAEIYVPGPTPYRRSAMTLVGQVEGEYASIACGAESAVEVEVSANGETSLLTLPRLELNTWNKLAFAWRGSEFAVWVNGELSRGHERATAMPRFNALRIGGSLDANEQSCTYVRRLRTYAAQISDPELIVMTS